MRGGLVTAVLVGIALKLILAASPPAGYVACYQSTLTPPPAGQCERSFENPFVRFDATRVDAVLDFGPATWDLSFFNSQRFNFYPWLPDTRVHDRLPFTVTWRGVVETGAEDVVVTYAGQGSVAIGSTVLPLPPAYDRERTLRIPGRPGTHDVLIRYTFDDGSLTDDNQPRGPYATFALTSQQPGQRAATPIGADARRRGCHGGSPGHRDVADAAVHLPCWRWPSGC